MTVLAPALGLLSFLLAVGCGLLVWPHLVGSKPQHGGAGEGALSVWELRVRLAFEAGQRVGADTGRHHHTARRLAAA